MTDGVILITWGATRRPGPDRGWLPVVRGRSIWHGHGFSRDEALAMAESEARDEASRYVGDWDIRVLQENTTPALTR